MKKLLLLIVLVSTAMISRAQTINDGIMMPKGSLCTGFLFTHDEWKNYWEADLRRDNGNIGTLTTRSLTWVGNYGVTNRLNVIAMVPYIWTKASAGTLMPMEGVQDLTLAAKYNVLNQAIGTSTFKAFGSLAVSTPLTDYTADFFPLSLGTATTNLSWRGTANLALAQGLYFNVTGAYTWRSNTTLDRAAYYTDGQMYLTNEVKMPNVADYTLNVGYLKGNFQADLNFMQMITLGGGDIRRQDMPFVSNRMNASRVGAFVMYYIPAVKNLAVRAAGNYTVAGRNVGQSTTVTAGLLYTIRFINAE